jgi:hypothetical protein
MGLLIPAGSYRSALILMNAVWTHAIIIADSLEDPAIILSESKTSALYFDDVCGALTFDAPSYS